MKRKLMLLLTCLFVGIGLVTAQSQKVTGIVVSGDDGQPVIGASILVKGTTLGTTSDIDGKFVLNVPASGKTLVVSYIGMVKSEFAIKPNMRIELKSNAQVTDEVVITGYGNFKKASFTGSASSLSTDKLKDVPDLSLENKLAGSISGVQISSTSGQPGSVASVRIRGMGSMNASNEPLYVIDGVPMVSGDMGGFTYASAGNSILSTINSNDIESMTVIKDAAAASLYGSRAANGVIVITTKKGNAGKTRINLRADWGMSDMAVNYRPTLNGDDRRDLLYMGLVNYSMNNSKPTDPELDRQVAAKKYADSKIDEFAAKPWGGYTDWKDVLFRKGKQQSYEINAQGGNANTRFYSSLAYNKQDGITLQSGYERYTGRASVTHTSDRITLEASTMFTKSKQLTSNEKTSYASPIRAISMGVSPSSFPYNEDGTFSTNFPLCGGANPLQSALLNYSQSDILRSLNALTFGYKIAKGLTAKEVLSYDYSNTNDRVWWDPRSNDGKASSGVSQRIMQNRTKLSSQTQLNYIRTFAGVHNVDALIGYETEDYKNEYIYASGSTFPTFLLPEITNASTTKSVTDFEGYRMISYLGRLNYDYMSKYYVSASMRRDGSSRLSSDSRWGNFWSVSGSWRLSQEGFMETIKNVVSDAKLRASYGVNGTQPIDYYKYMGVYEFGSNYAGKPGSAESRIANNNLKWEKNYSLNLGLDLTFWNRIFVSLDWYNRDTKDLLMDKAISAVSGFSNMLVNVGSIRNRGFEMEIKSNNVTTKDFTWSSTLNLSHNSNKLLKLDGEQTEMLDATYPMIHRVGEAYNSFYAYEYAGVDPATGKESYYVNANKDDRSVTTDATKAKKVIIGKSDPVLIGGITNTMNYKAFDFGFTFTYSLGGNCYDYATWVQTNGGDYNFKGNVPSYYKMQDTWQKPGDDAKLPQFVYGNKSKISSRWMLPNDYLRLKNITLGFTLPSNLSKKAGLSKVRAYFAGSNLLTFKSKDLYLDPEGRSNGVVQLETPALKTVTFGLEIGF